MANIMTYAQAIEIAVSAMGENHPEAVERLKALSAQLAKRSKGSKNSMTKTQKANEVIKKMILEILAEAEEPVNMPNLMADPRLPEDVSSQKLGALIGQLIKDGKVVKGKDKKHVTYTLAEAVSAEDEEQ